MMRVRIERENITRHLTKKDRYLIDIIIWGELVEIEMWGESLFFSRRDGVKLTDRTGGRKKERKGKRNCTVLLCK